MKELIQLSLLAALAIGTQMVTRGDCAELTRAGSRESAIVENIPHKSSKPTAEITALPPPHDPSSHLASAPFAVDPSYLSRHEIVYLAPMQLEAEGFPLGNGNMGGMIWTHDNGIELQINKNDVWSSPEDGGSPTKSPNVPRHCARVKIDFGLPVFGWIYNLNNFEGRLSLAKGEAVFKAQTGYSITTVRSWLVQNKNVWVIECENTFTNKFVQEGNSLARVSLERIGSRAFGGWYAGGFSPNPESGIGSTKTDIQGNTILIEEGSDHMHFVVACRVLNGSNHPLRINNHRVEQYSEKSKFTVLVSVSTAEDALEPKNAALSLLEQAERETVPNLKAEKDEWFSRFWSKSFLKLGDDYLENIYYLRRYLMGIGSRGKYPVVFNGGLWRWNRDVVNWVTPHHWNTQQQYWGLCAQNDGDLLLPYLNTYYRMMRQPGMTELAARRGVKEPAILLAEMHNFDGTMVNEDRGDMKNDLTPASQVASRFWEYYEYSGDKAFLESKGYAFMREAANFYLQKLEWKQDTKCFSLKGSVYEDGNGQGPVENPLSDRNCIEALFKSCIQAAATLHRDSDLTTKWQYVLDHLWERRLVREDGIEGEVIAPCDTSTAGGRYSTKDWAVGGAIAFPAELIGIDQKDTPLGKAVMNFIRSLKGNMYSHHPTPVIAARMGAGDEAVKLLKDAVTELQIYPQGLMTNVRGYPTALYDLKLKANLLGPGKCTITWRDFFQCGMEPISICGTALNEMMLQSNERVIRVFPAIPGEWKDSLLAFKLLARGGFLVAAERQKGKTMPVSVKSLRGNVCRLQNPWAGQAVTVYDYAASQPLEFKKEPGDVISFDTRENQEYILCQGDDLPRAIPTVFASNPNPAPKEFGGSRMLGVGKRFEAGVVH